MVKPDRTVLTQAARVALGSLILVALMLIVYAVIGRLTAGVAFGGLYSWALGALNFLAMGAVVQGIAERMAEKERSEEEIAELSTQMSNRMKLSYNLRMIALFALLVLGIAVFHFDALATILSSVFPAIVVRILQIVEAKKPASPKEVKSIE